MLGLQLEEEKKIDTKWKTCTINELYNILPFNCLLIDIRTTEKYNKLRIWKSKSFDITVDDIQQTSNKSTEIMTRLTNSFSAKSKIIKHFVVISNHKNTDNIIYEYIYSLFSNIQSSDPNTENYELYVLSETVPDFYKQYPFYCIGDSNKNNEQYAYPNCILLNELYLGTGQQATAYDVVRNLNISHILNVTKDVECIFSEKNADNKLKIKPIKYLQLKIDDVEHTDIAIYFEDVAKFINDALHDNNKKNRVLVHCEMGVSRSSSYVLAYLMKYKNMRLCDAYKLTKQCRQLIHPNNAFFRQLIAFEKKLYNGKSTDDKIKQFKLRHINMNQKVVNLKMGLVQAIKVKRNKVINKKKKKKKKTTNMPDNLVDI